MQDFFQLQNTPLHHHLTSGGEGKFDTQTDSRIEMFHKIVRQKRMFLGFVPHIYICLF